MNINELLRNEIKDLGELEREIVEFIFKTLENNRYMSSSMIEEKVLGKIDEKLGG